MSDTTDTTGWQVIGRKSYAKLINGYWWFIEHDNGKWLLCCNSVWPSRPTLRECQALAHDTARLWNGSDE